MCLLPLPPPPPPAEPWPLPRTFRRRWAPGPIRAGCRPHPCALHPAPPCPSAAGGRLTASGPGFGSSAIPQRQGPAPGGDPDPGQWLPQHRAVPEGREALREQPRRRRGCRQRRGHRAFPDLPERPALKPHLCPWRHRPRGSQMWGSAWRWRRAPRVPGEGGNPHSSAERAPTQCPARSDCPRAAAGPGWAGVLGKRLPPPEPTQR